MSKTLAAVTTAAPIYPGYVNFSENEDGSVVVTTRGAPSDYTGVAVCGQDCTPGSARCNNYCNQAPEKGVMAAAPPTMAHTKSGHVVAFVMTAAEWANFRAQVAKA